MGYTYLTDLAHPKKLHRWLETDLPYIPWRVVLNHEQVDFPTTLIIWVIDR